MAIKKSKIRVTKPKRIAKEMASVSRPAKTFNPIKNLKHYAHKPKKPKGY